MKELLRLGEYSCTGDKRVLLYRNDIEVSTTTPSDYQFIDSLMKVEASKVGFLQERTWSKYVWGGERNFMTFLCRVNNDTVGYVLLTPGRGINKAARIQQIVIRHDARRLEYGTALVDVCAAFCRKTNAAGLD